MSAHVEVRNVGPLLKVNVDLKDLVCITGGMSHGKTALANILHAVQTAACRSRKSPPLVSWYGVPADLAAEIDRCSTPSADPDETNNIRWAHLSNNKNFAWAKMLVSEALQAYGMYVTGLMCRYANCERSELRRRELTRRVTGCSVSVVNTDPAWKTTIVLDTGEITVDLPSDDVCLRWAVAEALLVRHVETTDWSDAPRPFISPSGEATADLFKGWPLKTSRLPASRTWLIKNVDAAYRRILSSRGGYQQKDESDFWQPDADFVLDVYPMFYRGRSRAAPEWQYASSLQQLICEGLFDSLGCWPHRGSTADWASVMLEGTCGEIPLSQIADSAASVLPLLLLARDQIGDARNGWTVDSPDMHLEPSVAWSVARVLVEQGTHGNQVIVAGNAAARDVADLVAGSADSDVSEIVEMVDINTN